MMSLESLRHSLTNSAKPVLQCQGANYVDSAHGKSLNLGGFFRGNGKQWVKLVKPVTSQSQLQILPVIQMRSDVAGSNHVFEHGLPVQLSGRREPLRTLRDEQKR